MLHHHFIEITISIRVTSSTAFKRQCFCYTSLASCPETQFPNSIDHYVLYFAIANGTVGSWGNAYQYEEFLAADSIIKDVSHTLSLLVSNN